MKMIKIALLGTAALAAVSVSAQASTASDIAALKAQVAALTAAQAASTTDVPAGFQLISVTTAPAIVAPGQTLDANYAATATTISVVPTADAPATTVVQWSGFVRAALVYQDVGTSYSDAGTYANIKARAELKVTGTTDTAVGEVGAWVKLRANAGWSKYGYGATGSGSNYTSGVNRGSAAVTSPGAWGWWKMTPDLTLGAGMDGSLAGEGYGYDGACSCYYTDNANAGYGHDGDPVQMRLSYASGPMSAAIAIEDYTNNGATNSSTFGVAAKVGYAGDSFSGQVSGGYWPLATGLAGVAAWNVSAGAKVALSDMGNISASAGTGNDDHVNGNSFWRANILGSLNLSEQAHAELGFNHYDSTNNNKDQNAVLVGLYYEPVKQLTIGLEGEWMSLTNVANSDVKSADLVTVFRF